MRVNRVFFDARFIRIGHHDGISRFSVGLANALVKRVAVTAVVYDEAQLRELDPKIDHVFANDPTKVSEIGFARCMNKLGAELVYSPMNTTGSMGRKFKLVLSQHDMIYYKHRKPPTDLNWLLKLGWRLFHLTYWPQRFTLARGDALVTVSETSKREMQRARLYKGEIAVVLNASGSEIGGEVAGGVRTTNLAPNQRRNLVYMGSFMPYKNVETLIDAMQFLPGLELHLLSRVSPKRREELSCRILESGGKVVWHNGVTDEEYLAVLDGALALVTASFDEGFGIPIVEAQARGIPAVVSDIEIFHEIVGEQQLFFMPNASRELAEQIARLRDAREWTRQSQLALANSQRFSWQQSADSLLALFDRL